MVAVAVWAEERSDSGRAALTAAARRPAVAVDVQWLVGVQCVQVLDKVALHQAPMHALTHGQD